MDGANRIAERTRELTPGAKVLISPYGIFAGNFDNPKFAEQIKRLNVESFTWDRKLNTWYSTLIPAAFGRYLSQIAAASMAGADRIISFAVCGTFDKPGSSYPVGQPSLSNEAYENYMSWRSGNLRWKLLEECVTDGKHATENPSDPRWKCYPDGTMEIVVDLGKKRSVSLVAGHFCDYRQGELWFLRALKCWCPLMERSSNL